MTVNDSSILAEIIEILFKQLCKDKNYQLADRNFIFGTIEKKESYCNATTTQRFQKKFRHPYKQHTVITVTYNVKPLQIPDSSIKKKEDVSTFSIHIFFFFFIQKERKKTMIILIIIKDEKNIDRKLKITTDRGHWLRTGTFAWVIWVN